MSIVVAILIVGGYIIRFENKQVPYTEIQNQNLLKVILKDTKSKNNDKNCRWEYGWFQEYHLFALLCVPKVDPSSFYTIEKRYKIKKEFLKVDDEYIMFGEKIKIRMNEKEMGHLGLPIDSVIIHWDE